jgi:hypothetical protein
MMQRTFPNRLRTLFSGTDSDTIKIYIDEISHDKTIQPANRPLVFHDKAEHCMKRLIKGCTLLNVESQSTNQTHPQIVLHLNDIHPLKMKLVTAEKLVADDYDKAYLFTKCAAESVVRLLYDAKLLFNDLVVFQAIRGGTSSNHFDIFSGKLRMTAKPLAQANTGNDTVSMVTAYVEEGKICIDLNKVTKQVQDDIMRVLSEAFNIANHATPRLKP